MPEKDLLENAASEPAALTKEDFLSLRGASFRANLGLWCPQHKAILRLLRKVLSFVVIGIPAGLSFARLRGVLTVPVRGRHVRRWGKEVRVYWPGDSTILHPAWFLDLIAADLPSPIALRCQLKIRRFDIHLIIYHQAAPVGYAYRKLHLERQCKRHLQSHCAHHELLLIEDGFRKSGIGSRLLANSIDLYRALRIRAITLVAGLSDGSLVWPILGFRPESTLEWKNLAARIRWRASTTSMPAALREAVDEILVQDQPTAIWAIADLPRDTAAQLLQKLRWKGILDLWDTEAMARLTNYLIRKGIRSAE